MRYSVISALAAATAVNAGGCSNPTNEGGNYFCSAVKQIKYGGLDIAGSYRAVSHMDNTGACTFEDKNYSGPIAPFDEEVRPAARLALSSILALSDP